MKTRIFVIAIAFSTLALGGVDLVTPERDCIQALLGNRVSNPNEFHSPGYAATQIIRHYRKNGRFYTEVIGEQGRITVDGMSCSSSDDRKLNSELVAMINGAPNRLKDQARREPAGSFIDSPSARRDARKYWETKSQVIDALKACEDVERLNGVSEAASAALSRINGLARNSSGPEGETHRE